MYTIPVLRNVLLPTCGFVCLLLGMGCGDSVECVVDTDCPRGNRCEAEMCVDLSTPPDRDTGPAVEDAGPEDTGSGVMDSGSGDAGSDAADVGPMDGGGDAGSLFACDFDGMYAPTEVSGNPAGCLSLVQCAVATTDGITNVDCDAVSGDCAFDADCVCTGTTIVADFTAGTFQVLASGMTCDYTLSAI